MNIQAANLLELLGGGGGHSPGEGSAKGDGPGKGRARGAKHFLRLEKYSVVFSWLYFFCGGFSLEEDSFYTTRELSGWLLKREVLKGAAF